MNHFLVAEVAVLPYLQTHPLVQQRFSLGSSTFIIMFNVTVNDVDILNDQLLHPFVLYDKDYS